MKLLLVQRTHASVSNFVPFFPNVAIHIVAHLINIERYHNSQSEEAGELQKKLSGLGKSPNESYLNPIRTYEMVSCHFLVFLMKKISSVDSIVGKTIFQSLLTRARRCCQRLTSISAENTYSELQFSGY